MSCCCNLQANGAVFLGTPCSFSRSFQELNISYSTGYGNIVPKTTGGRAFCIIYALIGIPIACLALKSLGERITVFEASLIKSYHKAVHGHDRVHAIHLKASILNFAVTIIAVLLLAGMAKLKRSEWSFFECIYFVSITFTTIGFGDYLPTYKDQLSEYDILTIVLGFFIGFSLVSSLLCSVSNALEEQGRTVLRKARKTIVSRKGKRSIPSSYSMESELATSNDEKGKAEEKSSTQQGIALRKVSTKHEKDWSNGKELAIAKVVFENEHATDAASRSS